jgi:hypothetical protein
LSSTNHLPRVDVAGEHYTVRRSRREVEVWRELVFGPERPEGQERRLTDTLRPPQTLSRTPPPRSQKKTMAPY